ncbi:MAG: hypothetical protein AAB817_00905, partial [Patescibacteria group bacterium]
FSKALTLVYLLMNEDVLGPNGIYSLRLTAPSSPTMGWLEVQWVTWRPGDAWSDTAATERLFSPTELQSSGGVVVPLAATSGVPYAYRIKLKALYQPINDLTITGYNSLSGNGASVPLPLITAVETTARVDRATQRVTVTMPRRSPLYGLFDYAVFSETDLAK